MSIDGTYDLTMQTPMGPQKGSVTFASNGSELTGHMEQMGNRIDISDGTIDETGAVAWKAKMTKPMPISMEATGNYADDKIVGDVSLGPFGKAAFEATRT